MKIATAIKARPKMINGNLISSNESEVFLLSPIPNKAIPNRIAPIVVPKELIPPANVKRCAPVAGLPILIAKGLATIC
ncbi:hypothetical protein D3C87_1834120 [compost metagenome]